MEQEIQHEMDTTILQGVQWSSCRDFDSGLNSYQFHDVGLRYSIMSKIFGP